MKDIDFLPAHYGERRKEQHAQVWRTLMLIGFGGLLCLLSATQLTLRHRLKGKLIELDTQSVAAVLQEQQLALLQADIKRETELAELFTYLKHPWPRTQILAELLRPLPEPISLIEMKLGRETPGGETAISPPAAAETEAEIKAMSDVKATLQKLRTENDSRKTVVYLEGITEDDTNLHSYVAELQNSPMFSAAELISLETMDRGAENRLARFKVRISVRPGFGQPNGPQKPTLLNTANRSLHEVER